MQMMEDLNMQHGHIQFHYEIIVGTNEFVGWNFFSPVDSICLLTILITKKSDQDKNV